MIGERIGSYQITSKLAEGGMGAVYVAHHDLMQRDAVVKVLLPAFSENTDMVKRFFNEARAAASIHHPGIVEVYDLGFMSDSRAYIVMEKLRGETLTARIAREGRLSVERATTFVLHMASALGAAHDAGIIHRDLKPDNLFVIPDPGVSGGERIKVVDFGIAKLQVNPGSLATVAGSIFGTPAYMAPEQCSDAATVDGRADVYALGCIFYEMLCGDPPFGKTGGIELLAAQLRDTPALPRTHNPDIPEHIQNVIMRALEKKPDVRYASCAELAKDLGVHSGELRKVVAAPSPSNAPDTEEAFAPTAAPVGTAATAAPVGTAATAAPVGTAATAAPVATAATAAPAATAASVPPAAAISAAPLTTHSAASGQVAAVVGSTPPDAMLQETPKSKVGLYALIGAAVLILGGGGLLIAKSGGGNGDGDKNVAKTSPIDAGAAPVNAAADAAVAAAADAGVTATLAAMRNAAKKKDWKSVAALFAVMDKNDSSYDAAKALHATAMAEYGALVKNSAVQLRKTRQCVALRRLAAKAAEISKDAGALVTAEVKQCHPAPVKPRYGSLVGVAKRANGHPVARLLVKIVKGPSHGSIHTSTKGAFAFHKLKPGRYTVACGRNSKLYVSITAGKRQHANCHLPNVTTGKSAVRLTKEAVVAMKRAQFGKALLLCRQALRKRRGYKTAVRVCALASCSLRRSADARRYIAQLRGVAARSVRAICLRHGVRVPNRKKQPSAPESEAAPPPAD